MTKKLIRADDLHTKAMRNPAYSRAHAALRPEYELASAFIGARAAANLTQEQLAGKMGTTRTVIARLESGRQMPSTRTLERFAAATGHRLRIVFEPLTGPRQKPTSRAKATVTAE
jgi:transcriptional regulator with XRE-family HTH domain